MLKKLLITENRTEKLLLVHFYCLFVKEDGQKLCVPFGPHCIISACTQDYELKLNIQTNFDTLISNLKLNFQ